MEKVNSIKTTNILEDANENQWYAQQKQQVFRDVYTNIIPERVPINVSLNTNVVAGYAGVPGGEALWNPSILEDAAMELADRIPTDVSIFAGGHLVPSFYQAAGSKCMKISSTGLMQHPNHVGMLPEDYDAFIENAYDCIIERILPRNYTGLDFKKEPVRAMFTIAQGMEAKAQNMAKNKALGEKIRKKHGGYVVQRAGCYAAADILTDCLRSLSGMAMDIRRRPDKVEAAVNSVYPLNYKVGLPSKITDEMHVFFPLHLATYLKEKDFKRLWWPAFYRQVTDYASLGIHSHAFCEHDWMRYLDYLQDLPTNTVLQFEHADPQLIKDKLGRKHILTGGFPLSILRTATKRQCIDKTKEFLDIMMPGGKFIFQFDKNPLTFGDICLENLEAVCQTVYEYGRYPNAGEKAGQDFNRNDYTHSPEAPFESKYYRTWDEYLRENPLTPECAKAEVMAAEDMIVKFIYSLCQ
ncbi:uroporphyrinogen decarboxylase [Eubacterium limosum]|uniref:uroporphyrinogen decarboxylase n=1 Tax=Eubacterium limosum TaxID=1736 RepID=UPI0022E4F755|nr:uroporphyrinogen decarboxylase [Eubacterium limosum]